MFFLQSIRQSKYNFFRNFYLNKALKRISGKRIYPSHVNEILNTKLAKQNPSQLAILTDQDDTIKVFGKKYTVFDCRISVAHFSSDPFDVFLYCRKSKIH